MSGKHRKKHSRRGQVSNQPQLSGPQLYTGSENRVTAVFATHPTYDGATDVESNSEASEAMFALFEEALDFLLAQATTAITVHFGMERSHPNNMVSAVWSVRQNLGRNPRLLRTLQVNPQLASKDDSLRRSHYEARMRDAGQSDDAARAELRQIGTPYAIKELDWLDNHTSERCRFLLDRESPSLASWCFAASKGLNFQCGREAFEAGDWDMAAECYDRAIQFSMEAVDGRDRDSAERCCDRLRRQPDARFLISRGSAHRRTLVPYLASRGAKITSFGETVEPSRFTRPMDWIKYANTRMNAAERRKYVLMELFLYAVRDLNMPAGMLDIPTERWDAWFREFRTLTQPVLRVQSEAWRTEQLQRALRAAEGL